MRIDIEPKTTDRIHAGPVLQQTSFWAKVKANHGLHTLAFNLDPAGRTLQPDHEVRPIEGTGMKESRDLLVILQRPGSGASVAYIPYGPKFRPPEEERGFWLENLSESMRCFLPEDCIMIRYDLVWDSPWANDENRYDDSGKWMGPPDAHVREMRMNFDTTNWQLRKAPTDILPSHTVFIDLALDENSILSGMKPKTRYNIRLAKRKGVRVRQAMPHELGKWYRLYRETAIRNGLYLDDEAYFETVMRTNADHTGSPADIRLLLAEAGGIPLAGMFLAMSGGRATYLYGASSGTNRNLMGSYALQWEAIRLAKEHGCTHYDLFGISQEPDPSHPMYGLYRFKTGFGGRIRHRQGCWDYPLHEQRYENYRAAELAAPGYHL